MMNPPFAAPSADAAPEQISNGVQVLSVLTFGAFSIVAVVLAFASFWPAGVAVAVLIAWRGGFLPHRSPARQPAPQAPESGFRPSGNASFDAYRARMIDQLETEQRGFESFLTRLREARDKTEFDAFLDDRARRLDPPALPS
jgi:hypothetical protein